ncbi:LysR family transcriptional regulator [Ureibacillus massiliensis 4400831 = CIP 108448 = CCUG 49529]|uniref:LysR family transcriptional regulator n=1 Tax=Ureibacillus massiliensis 4400831 = CIP 108448 = CCUG 49529 TaxID=1211035 RepID=A0A0A3J229_9BACL|nr:LysR family transcriptional regulator [Ureibacillus massiliensis]KGR90996.1 LysR family transcriptional regulator [Ureibacillus massiliensis 4400831 = CIP 108448 = CCUG 49529]
MTLQQLKYVIEVARSRSISKAAQNLFISQPSLSNALKELEKEIGITIFSRTNKGIIITQEGTEFLGYARQVVEQAELLENRYSIKQSQQQHFSVSAQHYAFAVSAFVRLLKNYNREEYEFTLRETKTYEIIEDVKNLRSEIGILYINEFNQKVISKFLREGNLEFHELFEAKPHVFISSKNPLVDQDYVTLSDLIPYPYLSFEQGDYNSFYFSEEILSTLSRPKNIKVSDRATLFNLLIGLNGYTISTGVISKELNSDIVSIPLKVDERIVVGYITHKNISNSRLADIYIDYLKETIKEELSQL